MSHQYDKNVIRAKTNIGAHDTYIVDTSAKGPIVSGVRESEIEFTSGLQDCNT